MTEQEELIRDLNLQCMENNALRAKIRQLEGTIMQLRTTLAALSVDSIAEIESKDYEKPRRGRPITIDEQTRQRIKRLKEDGLSYREIARKEGVSLGMVSAIIKKNY